MAAISSIVAESVDISSTTHCASAACSLARSSIAASSSSTVAEVV
ncbi:hypothetical protein ACFQER_07915 [Halomicroarcula sp. GCM10025894]